MFHGEWFHEDFSVRSCQCIIMHVVCKNNNRKNLVDLMSLDDVALGD